MEMGHLYQRRARMMILRSAILKNNIMVKTVTRGGGPGGGAAQDTGEAGQHRAVARVLLNTPDPHIFLQERNPVRVLQL